MKIVFLDFDGVLNSEVFFRARGGQYLAEALDRAAVARVNALLARTGAEVVISSTWRLGYSLDELRAILARHGFRGVVRGVTPQIEDVGDDGVRVPLRVPRGLEIQAWIDAQDEPPESFVILDDDPDMEHLERQLVQTTFASGLLDGHVEAAAAVLARRPQ